MSLRTLTDRFWVKVHCDLLSDDCWWWRGALNDSGYGIFHADGGTRRAHRVSYEMFVGPIPEGLVIDHLCHNRSCVNPGHLEAVEREENSRRQIPWNRHLTHCKHGHELEGDNLYINPGSKQRVCITCRRKFVREGNRRWRARQNAK